MKRFVTITVAFLLLLVVVCPIAPAPIAVLGGKARVQMPAVAIASIVFTMPLRLDRPMWAMSSDPVPLVSSTDLLDLTCFRLC